MDDVDLLPENFDSVNAICAYLRAQEPGRSKQAARGVRSRAERLLRQRGRPRLLGGGGAAVASFPPPWVIASPAGGVTGTYRYRPGSAAR